MTRILRHVGKMSSGYSLWIQSVHFVSQSGFITWYNSVFAMRKSLKYVYEDFCHLPSIESSVSLYFSLELCEITSEVVILSNSVLWSVIIRIVQCNLIWRMWTWMLGHAFVMWLNIKQWLHNPVLIQLILFQIDPLLGCTLIYLGLLCVKVGRT